MLLVCVFFFFVLNQTKMSYMEKLIHFCKQPHVQSEFNVLLQWVMEALYKASYPYIVMVGALVCMLVLLNLLVCVLLCRLTYCQSTLRFCTHDI